MCFGFSFIPATFLVVIGYFVLFSSTKTEGGVRKFGKVLAIWIFVIASFFPVMGAYVTITDQCPMERMMMR
jgi:Mn2+/Fe2+ NRAMP family transporter